jgi:signal transduction histidine kinase
MIEEKKIKIKIENLPVIKVEPTQFQQLFFNLIENAIKYSRRDVEPEIIIQSKLIRKKSAPAFYQISVCDNGIGFESEYEEKVFKLFERLHGKYEYSGTGIGLTICKKIVENHNGTITAKSELGKGSMFTITLPYTE